MSFIAINNNKRFFAPTEISRSSREGRSFAFTCYGARIGIQVNDPTALERIPHHLPPRWKFSTSSKVDVLYSLRIADEATPSGAGNNHELYSDPIRVTSTSDLDELYDSLESALEFSVAMLSRSKLFVHAGVVGWRGRAIVIPGRSFSGKTSLVEALVRSGATYYSDEFAVIDARGRVHPFARPLSIRQDGRAKPLRCSAKAMGGRVGARPLPIGRVVLVQYRPGARWEPRTLTPGEALLGLLDNTVLAQLRPGLALPFLRNVVTESVTLQGERDEADDLARILMENDCSLSPLRSACR